MTDLAISEARNTPRIAFDPETNEWLVCGRFYYQDADRVFAPLLSWISEMENNPVNECGFSFKLEFLNTHSQKILFDILKRVKQVFDSSAGKLKIKWYYEEDDEDMKETGELIMVLAGLPFELVAV